MKITVTLDYPDEYVERFGVQDAADTLAARLDELYPGPTEAGVVWNPEHLVVVTNADTPAAAHVREYGTAAEATP